MWYNTWQPLKKGENYMYLNDLLNNKNIKVTTIYQSATWNLGVSNNTIIEYEENGETKQIIIDETKLSDP
jgi:hypothetical protein